MRTKNFKIFKFSNFFATLLLLLPLGLVFMGCMSEKPPEIYLGSDRCDHCGMVISDKRFAGIYYSEKDKKWKKFDDVGEMVLVLKKDKVKEHSIYVFDYNTGKRIDATKAFYIVSHEIWTPMDTGVIAFEKKNDANLMAKKYNAKLVSFDKLLQMRIKMGQMMR